MAGNIQKEKNKTRSTLESYPTQFIDARASVLSNIALSREFAQTYLQGLCQKFTSSSGNYTLHDICKNLAKQRLICIGAHAIKDNYESFDLPTYETVNGALTLTEPNTTFMGFVCTTLDETTSITLQNTAGTQTIDGNTFSTQVTDYYLVRSRVSGELEDLSSNISAYTTPDGGDVVFGNAISFGSSVAGEEDANTWNYHWAKCNIASVAVKNAGTPTALDIMTLSDTITQGSNTDYTPVGPGFGQKFYLKRHADKINVFTITATTTTDSKELTDISETDMLKIKYNDVVSGTGIPSGAGGTPKLSAVMGADNKAQMSTITYTTGTVGQSANTVTLVSGTFPTDIQGSTLTLTGGGGNVVTRVSDTVVTLDNSATVSTGTSYSLAYQAKATANATITVTVNSVPFGHGKDDIFAQVECSAEGLVANSTWTAVGNDAGTYPSNSEHDLCKANTSQFIALLSFFDPGNAGSDDLIKGGSGAYDSSGKEYNETNYPDIEKNPIFPATMGTTKAAATAGGEITGTQPSGLGDKDVWCGRFVSWNKGRKNGADQAVGEYRYIVDNANKYFYAPASYRGYDYTTTDVEADPNHPPTVLGSPPAGSESEPRNISPRKGMATIVTRIVATSVTVGSTSCTNAHTTTVPADSEITYAGALSGTGQGPTTVGTGGVVQVSPPGDRSGSIGDYYILEANNIITKYHVQASIDTTTTCGSTTYVLSYANILDGPVQCKYNFCQKHMYEVTTANTDITFIHSTIDALQAVDAFRDPITTGTAAPRSASGGTAGPATGTGITDAAFDTYMASEPDGDITALEGALTQFRTDFGNSGRTSHPAGGSGKLGTTLATGSAVNFASLTGSINGTTRWDNLVDELDTFKDNCDKRISEIDARIGVPTYAGSAASRGNPPAIKVSTIPASNTTSGHVPYGRTIFNNVNHLLGKDVNLLGSIIKDIEALSNLVDLVKDDRNKYEILSGRDKEY